MLTFIQVQNFELLIEKNEERTDLVHLVLKINNLQYFRFPYYIINIENNLIKFLKDVIDGKEKTVDLNFNSNYNLIQFQKDMFIIFLLNDDNTITQELKLFFENNSIVRNGLRLFIDNYKPNCKTKT